MRLRVRVRVRVRARALSMAHTILRAPATETSASQQRCAVARMRCSVIGRQRK